MSRMASDWPPEFPESADTRWPAGKDGRNGPAGLRKGAVRMGSPRPDKRTSRRSNRSIDAPGRSFCGCSPAPPTTTARNSHSTPTGRCWTPGCCGCPLMRVAPRTAKPAYHGAELAALSWSTVERRRALMAPFQSCVPRSSALLMIYRGLRKPPFSAASRNRDDKTLGTKGARTLLTIMGRVHRTVLCDSPPIKKDTS
jgi:hypothetical protein